MKYNLQSIEQFLDKKLNLVIISQNISKVLEDIQKNNLSIILLQDLSIDCLRSLVNYSNKNIYIINKPLNLIQSSVLLKPIEDHGICFVFIVSSLKEISSGLLSRSILIYDDINENTFFSKEDFISINAFLKKVEFDLDTPSYSINEIGYNLLLYLYQYSTHDLFYLSMQEINKILSEELIISWHIKVAKIIKAIWPILIKT